MGDVYKSSYTTTISDGATIKGQVVTWTDKRGKRKTGRLVIGKDGSKKVSIEGSIYLARYRDETGHEVKSSTGCKTKDAALHFLHAKETEVERIKSGVVSRDELLTSTQKEVVFFELLALFGVHQAAKDVTPKHINGTRSKLERLVDECNFIYISNINSDTFEKWIVDKKESGLSHRTINSYTIALKTFLNWCVSTGRLEYNPISKLKKLNEAVDKRKERRSLTEDEFNRLIQAALSRNRRGKRTGEETALIYQTLVGTGLRSSELASIRIFQVDLIRNEIILKAGSEKRRKGTRQPFKATLGKKLALWIKNQMKRPQDYLFEYTPNSICDSFERDCQLANIPIKTEDGRSVDVHALRRTYGTMLARAGVPLTTTQRLMRHSTPELTARLYIDVEPVDIAMALDRLTDL